MTRFPTSVLGLLAVVLVLLVAGCSGGSTGATEPLSCAWLDGDNCWKTTVAMAAPCLPAPTETGVLSADNRTCTYASGATITFTPALTLPITTKGTWNFTVSKGGVSCLHYEATPGSQRLVVGDQTVSQRATRNIGSDITCPDGTSYGADNVVPLLSCGADAGAILGGLPGNTQTSTDDWVTFGLIGTGATQVSFLCQK